MTKLKKKTSKELDIEKLKAKRQPCEVYSRIVGYLRPVQNWNDGKKAEFADRTEFEVKL